MSPGKRRRGDNGDSIPVFYQQQKRGFQANNSRISDKGQQNTTERKKVFRSNNTKVVRGTAAATTTGGAEGRSGWGSAPSNIFVYHTAPDTTDQDVREAAKHFGNIVVKNVERRSNEYSYYGSFRVTIDRNDFDTAMSSSSWPSGWSVRQYFVSRIRSNANNSNKDSIAVVNNSQKKSPEKSPVASAVTGGQFNVLPTEVSA